MRQEAEYCFEIKQFLEAPPSIKFIYIKEYLRHKNKLLSSWRKYLVAK